MSKHKTDFTKMYIYVDIKDDIWFASDIHDDKKESIENWEHNFDGATTSNGFFLEVLVPSIKGVVESKIEDIPVYTI